MCSAIDRPVSASTGAAAQSLAIDRETLCIANSTGNGCVHRSLMTITTPGSGLIDISFHTACRNASKQINQRIERPPVENVGLDALRTPHVWHLNGKLWELRVKAAEGIARGIYVTASGRRVVVLHVFVKISRKTPRRALQTAKERMKQVTP